MRIAFGIDVIGSYYVCVHLKWLQLAQTMRVALEIVAIGTDQARHVCLVLCLQPQGAFGFQGRE